MKMEDVLAFLAVIFIVGVVGVALLPDSIWEGAKPQVALAPVAQGGGVAEVVAGGNVWGGASPQAMLVAAPGAGTPVDQVPQPGGMLPFERAPRVQFYGQIQQITEMQQNDGQVHVWIHDAVGGEKHISIAPAWFLKYMNCPLSHDMVLTGTGFQFDQAAKDGIIYAKKIQVDGRVCHLRNDEGFALWSNKLR